MEHNSAEPYRDTINEDDWHSVTDAKKRKQIQDRLAQRARRERLRKAQQKNARAGDPSNCASEIMPHLVPSDPLSAISAFGENDTMFVAGPLPAPIPSIDSSSSHQVPNIRLELPFALTVFSTLYINDHILGLSCNTIIPAISSPASADVPLPLHSTTAQLLMVHSTKIDRFPFAKMRDNAINMGKLFDEEEFTRDLMMTPSFSITPGAVSWDPRGWKIERQFAEKWGFLFL